VARHIYPCPLRWSDMDAFGHVNNVVFLRYLEEARVDLMWRLGPGAEGESFSGGVVVARHEIDYVKPLVHRHTPVTVETWVTRIGAASLDLAYEVKDEGAVYVRARSVLAPYDLERGTPRRVTREERLFLEAYLEDGSGRGPKPAGRAAGARRGETRGEALGAFRDERGEGRPEGAVVG
jgi:acyl-CoA thioester hydrolase